MSDTNVAAERPHRAEAQTSNPLREVIDRMDRVRSHVAQVDSHLSNTVAALAERADRPGMTENPSYRTRVAYALQDLEKLVGPVMNMPDQLRQEMGRLATTVPGLQNERLQELMQRTPAIQDPGLVRDIRIVASDTASRPAQDTAAIRDRVEVLENRTRLASGSAEGPSAGKATAREAGAASPPSQEPRQAATAGGADPTRSTEPSRAEESRQKMEAGHPGWKQDVPEAQRASTAPPMPNGVQVRAPGLVGSIMATLARQEPSRPSPLDSTPSPLADRVSRFEQRMQEGREENSFRGAEQSGRAAVEALQAFANGPGAGVINRIREAAKTDPGGMAGVMSEMRAGGVYADLRQQFDGAMQKEKAFAAAYDRAATATGQYAKDRAAVDAIIGQRPDAEALTGRFQKLDAQVGEAAVNTPGRKEGKNALEELAEKAAEIISRAVDKVKAAFSSTVRASSSPSPSP
ncbi:hypothetical protein [Roseomonas mucosa]|uniref:hypothetical protein n=2 Tax=Roseomonas TaxID=125216 RepID=UPI001EF688D0|nr:hypothetical protein [Roseomonas mucosa]MCG7351427.1 hypothetical protein [Roseomonas mucosa]MCG7358086.1 hypothetical protein [Roseomonas mucosa]